MELSAVMWIRDKFIENGRKIGFSCNFRLIIVGSGSVPLSSFADPRRHFGVDPDPDPRIL